MRRFLTRTILFMAGGAAAFAQSPVVGVGTFIHVVANLDKTMRFYGDRLGLELNGAPGPRAFSVNAVVEGLYDAKGYQSRVAVFRIPGSPLGAEFAEFKDANWKPSRPRIQDPGASMLVLPVRDVGSVLARLKEDATPVISQDAAKGTVVVQDPDGFFIQLTEGGAAKLSLTVDSMDRTLNLFRDLLGFQLETGKLFVKDKDQLKLLGLRSASYRRAAAKVPGTDFEVEFTEFKGIDRKPVNPAIHDPGAGVLRLVVRDVDALLSKLKESGVPVASAGGEPVSIGNRHFVILRDPDHFFFQLVPQPNPAPK
ncbi:MAG TPA: VOC family protein [Bryobacteraceae bacterium]|nr:VOC family protein [Bryobacteraceae bacterium]